MAPQTLSYLADAILLVHLLIVAFNVFGLIAVPVGAWRRWPFVRIFWWRALHVGLLALVAVQAVWGRACLLTVWQYDLERQAGDDSVPMPLIEGWVTKLIFWPLPLWAFAVLYVLILIYVLLLWIWVPLQHRARSKFS